MTTNALTFFQFVACQGVILEIEPSILFEHRTYFGRNCHVTYRAISLGWQRYSEQAECSTIAKQPKEWLG